jgi:hypothetical protein
VSEGDSETILAGRFAAARLSPADAASAMSAASTTIAMRERRSNESSFREGFGLRGGRQVF